MMGNAKSRRTAKYFVFPSVVLLVAAVLWATGRLTWTLTAGEVLNVLFVAVFVSVTWFYADETAAMRRTAADELRLLSHAQEMSRASVDPPIDTLTLGVEVVNAGRTAARDIRLSMLFYQEGLSYTSHGKTTYQSDGEGIAAPILPVLLPGEIRCFNAPWHWKDAHYMSARLAVRITGQYEDGITCVDVNETVDISGYMKAAARIRMMEFTD